MSNLKTVLFIGGVSGERKTDHKPFRILSFGVPSERDNVFGYEVAQIFLSDRDLETFQIFRNKAKPGTAISADIRYSRGGWDLFDYKL